jgi:hypothetical protein
MGAVGTEGKVRGEEGDREGTVHGVVVVGNVHDEEGTAQGVGEGNGSASLQERAHHRHLLGAERSG